jgi:hypothetical protein
MVTAQKYFSKILESKHFDMKHLVIGPTTHIGKNRDGTPGRIQELVVESMDFGLTLVKPQLEAEGVQCQ